MINNGVFCWLHGIYIDIYRTSYDIRGVKFSSLDLHRWRCYGESDLNNISIYSVGPQGLRIFETMHLLAFERNVESFILDAFVK